MDDARALIQQFINHPVPDVETRCYDLLQRRKLLRADGDDVFVCKQRIGAMAPKELQTLLTKLRGLKAYATRSAANAPGLASKLQAAKQALQQAPVYLRKNYQRDFLRCDRSMKGAIRKQARLLDERVRRNNREQLAWQKHNAQVAMYLKERSYDNACSVESPVGCLEKY